MPKLTRHKLLIMMRFDQGGNNQPIIIAETQYAWTLASGKEPGAGPRELQPVEHPVHHRFVTSREPLPAT